MALPVAFRARAKNNFEISLLAFNRSRSCGGRDAVTVCWTENRSTKRLGLSACVTSGWIMSWITSGSNCVARSGYVSPRDRFSIAPSSRRNFSRRRSRARHLYARAKMTLTHVYGRHEIACDRQKLCRSKIRLSLNSICNLFEHTNVYFWYELFIPKLTKVNAWDASI